MGAALSEDRFIDVDGATLRVRVAGAGPAVVLVHGWALDLDMWRAEIDLLASSYRVIAFDRRGFGRSSGDPSIERDVLDIDRLLARFDIEHAAIVGMSQGARVALRWALKHPERTSSLVLDGPPAEGLSLPAGAEEIPIELYRQQLRHDGIEAFQRVWLQHPFMRLYTSASTAHQLLREIAARYPARDLQMNEPSPLSPLATGDLQRLHARTLVLSGEHDTQQRRSIARQLAAALPDARLQTLTNAGHLAALDDPGGYAQALHDFFSSRPARAVGTDTRGRSRWPE